MRACNQVTVQIGRATRQAHPRLQTLSRRGSGQSRRQRWFPKQACGRGTAKKEVRTRASRRIDSKTTHGPRSDELPPGHPQACGFPHPGSGGWQELSSLTALGALEGQDRAAEHKQLARGSTQPRRAPGGPPQPT